MDDNKTPEQKPHKTVIVLEGDKVCYAAFADAEQEKKIFSILMPPRIAH